MENLRPIEVNNRIISLNIIQLQLFATKETIKLIQGNDDCGTLQYTLYQVNKLINYIKQDLYHIELTGELPPEESNDRFEIRESDQESENSEVNLSKVHLDSPQDSSEF